MIAGHEYSPPMSAVVAAPSAGSIHPLRGRLLAVRRRRLILRMRDWLGIAVVACFAVTLFAITFFSLLGR